MSVSVDAFALSWLLSQALALEAGEQRSEGGGHQQQEEASSSSRGDVESVTFYEITIASVDQPKLLSRLSEALVSAPRASRPRDVRRSVRRLPRQQAGAACPCFAMGADTSCTRIRVPAAREATQRSIETQIAGSPRNPILGILYMQSDLGLNIREAHAFNTNDKFSLDVFVVDQWQPQVRGGP